MNAHARRTEHGTQHRTENRTPNCTPNCTEKRFDGSTGRQA
jgi:hypothetical protein